LQGLVKHVRLPVLDPLHLPLGISRRDHEQGGRVGNRVLALVVGLELGLGDQQLAPAVDDLGRRGFFGGLVRRLLRGLSGLGLLLGLLGRSLALVSSTTDHSESQYER
jgi:hypothetical protein